MSIAHRAQQPLRAGQRLAVQEFLRRWEAMPEVKFAELIDGVVYMPSPLSSDQWAHRTLGSNVVGNLHPEHSGLCCG